MSLLAAERNIITDETPWTLKPHRLQRSWTILLPRYPRRCPGLPAGSPNRTRRYCTAASTSYRFVSLSLSYSQWQVLSSGSTIIFWFSSIMTNSAAEASSSSLEIRCQRDPRSAFESSCILCRSRWFFKLLGVLVVDHGSGAAPDMGMSLWLLVEMCIPFAG